MKSLLTKSIYIYIYILFLLVIMPFCLIPGQNSLYIINNNYKKIIQAVKRISILLLFYALREFNSLFQSKLWTAE